MSKRELDVVSKGKEKKRKYLDNHGYLLYSISKDGPF